MNFDELYELTLEAAKNFGSPKNIGGGRLQGVKQSEKPSGFVSSSVGKSDNFQERLPIDQRNKKGFDPKTSIKQQKSDIEVSDEYGNTEVRKKTQDEKQNVAALIGKEKNALYNAFALLNNSGYFKDQIAEIIEKFGGIKTITSDEERDLKNLRIKIDQYNSVSTGLVDKIRQYEEVYKNYNDSEDVKIQTENDLKEKEALYDVNFKNLKKIGGGSDLIKVLTNLETLNTRKIFLLKNLTSRTAPYEIEKINTEVYKLEQIIKELLIEKPRYSNYVNKFKTLARDIEQLTIKHLHHKLKETDIHGDKKRSSGLLNILNKSKIKLEETEIKSEQAKEEYDSLQNYISKVSTHNENINDQCIENFKNAVIVGAKNILNSKFDKFDQTSISNDEVDWESDMPTRGDAYKMLTALTTDSNPIFKFIEKLDMPYLDTKNTESETRGAVRHDINRAMSDNENIGIIRDIERLPFFTIAQYLKTVSIATMPISTPITTESFKKAYRQFYTICNFDRNGEEEWNNPIFKIRLKKLLGIDVGMNIESKNNNSMGDAISDVRKISYEKIIDSPYDNRGIKSFKKLLSMVEADLRGAYPRKFESIKNKLQKGESINESFDQLASRYASSFNLDINDFLIDLQEVHSLMEKKCTGPTKKTSSDRKGKKWTKCAKQSDGSYKRIHWGQAGVRIGNDNPKRKKSFKKRHKCSSAKAGSPKAMACKDWA